MAQSTLQRESMAKSATEHERRWRAMFDNTVQFMGLLAANGAVLEANQAALDFMGLKVEDVVGLPFWETPWWATAPEHRAQARAAVERAAAGEQVRFEVDVHLADGTLRTVDFSLKPVVDEDGRVRLLVPEGRDITERRRSEDELRLLQTIALAIAEADDLTRALGITLRKVCDATGWCIGQAWVPRADGSGLDCSPAWRACPGVDLRAFRLASEAMQPLPGQGMAGIVFASREPVWMRDVSEDPRFIRAPAAKATGIGAGVGVPVLAGTEVVAVLEFFLFAPRDEDERYLRLVSAVAAQLGSVIQHKRAEAEQARLLQQAEAAEIGFRGLVESAPDAIVISDRYGRITQVNRQTEALFGYGRVELIGQPVELLVPERFRASHARQSARFSAHPRTRALGDRLDLYARRKDGSEVPVEISLSQMQSAGQVVVTSVIRDVTQRRRAERERARLLASERAARLRAEHLAAERAAILGQIADGVMSADRTGRLTFVNEAARRLHGTTQDAPAELAAARAVYLPVLGDEPYGAEDNPLMRAALDGESIVDAEIRIRRPDGSEVLVQASATPVEGEDGERFGAVLTLRDVTAQRSLERQKDEFLGNVSHDLRTPLAAIKASIGVVLANEPPHTPEPLHRMLVNVDVAADRMAKLVGDLLELTRLQAGRAQLHAEPCDLRALAARLVSAMEPLLQSRGQRIVADLPAGPLIATAEAERLERALLNLLSNAQKYGPAGDEIRFLLREEDGEARFSVSDNGPGIHIDEQRHIFERFYRPDSEASRRLQGSGLGLPIARAMVELHGGRIWVESEPGMGSTFWVSVPLDTNPTSVECP